MKLIACCIALAACAETAQNTTTVESSLEAEPVPAPRPLAPADITGTCTTPVARDLKVRLVRVAADQPGWKECRVEHTCAYAGVDAPPIADADCRQRLRDRCDALAWATIDWATVPIDEPCDGDRAKTELASFCAPTLTPSTTCDLAPPPSPVAGLCPSSDPTTGTIQLASGCRITKTTPLSGRTFLAEFGTPDQSSADFECQWLEDCSLTIADRGDLTFDDRLSTYTKCLPADGRASSLCADDDRAWIQQHASSNRVVIGRYRWVRGMRVYLDPGGAFYDSISLSEFRGKAQTACAAKALSQSERQLICNQALDAFDPSALSTRYFTCCTASVD